MLAKMCRSLTLLAALVLATPLPSSGVSASQHALRFYGAGTGQQDRVQIPIEPHNPLDVGLDFTIEFWMRAAASNNNGTVNDEFTGDGWITGNIIVDRDVYGAGDWGDYGIAMGREGAAAALAFGVARGANGRTIVGTNNVGDDLWHHVAVTRDASNGLMRLFVDGQLDAEAVGPTGDISYRNGRSTAYPASDPFLVLAAEKHDAGPAYPSYAGYLDEFRVWNRALSQKELLDRYDRLAPSNAPGLIAYYRFEEGSGTNALNYAAGGAPAGRVIAGAPGNGEWVSFTNDPRATAPVALPDSLPAGFERTIITRSLVEPTAIAVAPDGAFFVAQRSGAIWRGQGVSLATNPLLQIPVDTTGSERGLVGLALDPEFETNGYLYAYHTSTEPRNQVSRFTVISNAIDTGTHYLVWANTQPAELHHHGGGLAFGPDTNLYIGTGDQNSGANAQNLGVQHGKILRVERDGQVPPDNPFVNATNADPYVWAWGLRNPFRLLFDEPTATLWIGDVGGNYSDSWEEMNIGVAGANYGWPFQEGPICYTTNCSSYTPFTYGYQHNDPAYYRGQPQAAIIAGPRYRATVFPAPYRGNLFIGDYANRWIRRLVFNAGNDIVGDPIFINAPAGGTIVDMKAAPDGSLYVVTVGTPWTGAPESGTVYRISYSGASNRAPFAAASAAPRQGIEPLEVHFSSAGSYDPDDGPGPLTFAWSFGDGATSALPNPVHSYTNRGAFTAQLTVSDGPAASPAEPLLIEVGHPPLPVILNPPTGTIYRAGDTIVFEGAAADVEDGTLSASSFTWRVFLVHEAHTHPFGGPWTNIQQGQFVIPSSGHGPEHTFYLINLSVADSDGLVRETNRSIHPVIAPVHFATAPAGIPILLDGAPLNTPYDYESLPGFQHAVEAPASFVLNGTTYVFLCWSDGGERAHAVITPESGGVLRAGFAAETNSAPDVDSDGDGMPDCWELAYGFDPIGGDESGGDHDGDGMSNRDEFWAGTDPTNAASVFKVAIEPWTDPAGQMIVLFGRTGRTYEVQYATNLNGAGWQNLLTNLPGSNAVLMMLDTNLTAPRFYRSRLWSP